MTSSLDRDETAALEMVRGARSRAKEHPLGADERSPPELRRRRLHRDRAQALVLHVHLEVVLEVAPDAGKVGQDIDAEVRELGGRSDARQQQELGAVDRATGQDHLAGRVAIDAAAPPAPSDLDADGAGPLEQDPGHEPAGPDREVRALAQDRMEVGARRTQAAASVDIPIERREPLLPVAIDVLGQGIAGLLGGFEERPEERAGSRATLEHERAIVAAPRIVGRRGQGVLHLLEVRQAMGEIPCLHARVGRPTLEVEGVASLEDLAVDAG